MWNAATLSTASPPWHWAQPQCVRATKSPLLSLPLQFALWELHPDPSLLIISARGTASSELGLWFLSLSFLHLIFPVHFHMHTFRCLSAHILQCICVFSRESFFSYRCPTCNFKRRDLEVLSHRHAGYLALSSNFC